MIYSLAMEQNNNRYTEKFKIHSYEVDVTNTATLPAICQFLQEVASNHAEQLGFGVSWLLENQRTWMLSRMVVKMDSFPRVGEEILVNTWPSGTDRLLFLRDFSIERASGEVLGRAVSSWVYMNLESRRPVHPSSKEFEYDFSGTGERAIDINPGKVPVLADEVEKGAFRVRFNDLDMNNHVNNIKYIEWLMESVDPDYRRVNRPVDLSVNFLAEALYGQDVSVHAAGTGEFSHCVRDREGNDICRAESSWIPVV